MFEQINQIWKCLHIYKVKYIVIGGFAVNIHGFNRNTGDLDIYIEDTPENRKNLRKAFSCANIGDFESIETMQFIPGWTDFTLDYGFRLDVMTSVKGLEGIPFEKLLKEAKIIEFGEIPTYFLDFKHLIQAKRATNRLKDQLDLEELNKINPIDE